MVRHGDFMKCGEKNKKKKNGDSSSRKMGPFFFYINGGCVINSVARVIRPLGNYEGQSWPLYVHYLTII